MDCLYILFENREEEVQAYEQWDGYQYEQEEVADDKCDEEIETGFDLSHFGLVEIEVDFGDVFRHIVYQLGCRVFLEPVHSCCLKLFDASSVQSVTVHTHRVSDIGVPEVDKASRHNSNNTPDINRSHCLHASQLFRSDQYKPHVDRKIH